MHRRQIFHRSPASRATSRGCAKAMGATMQLQHHARQRHDIVADQRPSSRLRAKRTLGAQYP
jgi:hypothetical protein